MFTMTEEELGKARKHIIKNDPILGKVILRIPPFEKDMDKNYFLDLAESIVSQQLSVKAADTIWGRFKRLFPEKGITPEKVVAIDKEKMRECGISYQKIAYIKDLAQKTIESGIVFEQFDIMADEEIITELVKVKGIGRWTAEMFLMFSMERPDIFSYGDLGLRRAIQKLYALDKEPTQNEAEKIAAKWKPYRTLASRYLWKSLDNA
jgi:DNA-3-methyladenine glycosylase II